MTGGTAPADGVLGAGSGGESEAKCEGTLRGEPTNLVNTTSSTVESGYSNTAWEIEATGGGGSYGGQATVGSNGRGEVAGIPYGDRNPWHHRWIWW